jgi:hypothetical protein
VQKGRLVTYCEPKQLVEVKLPAKLLDQMLDVGFDVEEGAGVGTARVGKAVGAEDCTAANTKGFTPGEI